MRHQSKNNFSKTNNHTDSLYLKIWGIATGIGVFVTIITGMWLTTQKTKAEANSTADSVSVSIPVACTMVGTVEQAHTTSIIGGTRVPNIGTTKINTVCNDKNGYLAYAKGTTQNANNEAILSANIGSDYDIRTGTSSPSDGRSSWGMQLAPVTGDGEYPPTITADYDSYHSVPSTWTKVASRSSGTSSVARSQFTTTYAVYTTIDQPAGTYSGNVEYVMLHPSTTSVMPTNTLEQAFAAAGKSKKSDILDPTTGQTGSYYRMQDMESAICNAAILTDGDNSIQLVDDRDNKLYWVTKLTDSHCWMTQNLDLDLSPSRVLTSEDTDLNDSSVSGAYSVGYSYNPDSRIISWKPTNTTRDYQNNTGTAWARDNSIAYSLDPGSWYWDGDDSTPNCNYLNPSAGCTHFTQSATDANAHLAVGNYYNWSAAIASDDSSSLNTSTYENINLNPQNSICPKGWRLPTISNVTYTTVNSTSEFGRLNQLYNGGGNTDPKLISSPLWFVRSGYYGSQDTGTSKNTGYEANYWSSTIKDIRFSYGLVFTNGNVVPNSFYEQRDFNLGRRLGWSVRCVAR